MLNIVSDTSTMFSVADGLDRQINIMPLSVAFGGNSYREFDEINAEELVEKIEEGRIPTSSQPSVGEVLACYDSLEGEILNITMADGLSGTYQTACSAREASKNKSKITVINSRTLCGPHRYLVLKAVELAKSGKNAMQVVNELKSSMDTNKSFLIPNDFAYLKRGGRLAPLAANVGAILKLVPIMTQTADGKRLEKHTLCRNFESALNAIVSCFEKMGVNDKYEIYVSHNQAENKAIHAVNKITHSFPNIVPQIFELSPAFITQGGPGCIAVQAVLK